MNKFLLTKKIEEFAPPETAEPWDCVGFMAETGKTEVSKVMVCLTPTDDVITQALNTHCDMIVSHHPMFYVNFTSGLLDDRNSPQIDIYSAHTNMDRAEGGTTDTIINALWLKAFQKQINHEFLRKVELETPVTVEDFAKKLLKISPNLRYVNNKKIKEISKIFFSAGSGAEFIQDAKNLGADCLVTADLKFHTALDSDIVVFDLGHFESEILIREVFKKIIGDEVEVIFAEEVCPFIYP